MNYILNVKSYFNFMIHGHDHACSIYVAIFGPIYMMIVRESKDYNIEDYETRKNNGSF